MAPLPGQGLEPYLGGQPWEPYLGAPPSARFGTLPEQRVVRETKRNWEYVKGNFKSQIKPQVYRAVGRSKPWEPYLGGNPGNPTLAPLPGQGLEPYLGGQPWEPYLGAHPRARFGTLPEQRVVRETKRNIEYVNGNFKPQIKPQVYRAGGRSKLWETLPWGATLGTLPWRPSQGKVWNPTLGGQPWEPYLGAPPRARFGTIPWGATLGTLPWRPSQGKVWNPTWGGNPGNPTVTPLPGQGLEPYQSRGL